MFAAFISSIPHEPCAKPLARRSLAAVCALAFAALGSVACTSRAISQAPLPGSAAPASATFWPTSDGDPSLPSAAEALKGRTFDDSAEPAPTF